MSRTATALLRLAQLGRAFAVHLIVCGQRIGSDLGPGVTALRAQLSGRVCHRVNDPETANMTLGDLDPAALDAARAIPAETPGVASWPVKTALGTVPAQFVPPECEAEQAARDWAHLTPDWDALVGSVPVVHPAA